MKIIFIKKLKILIIFACLGILLNGCGLYRKTDSRKISPNVDDRVKKNVEEGRGFRLSEFGKNSGTFDFATSNSMWRATIEILDFIPLNNADYSGGIIITDWYQDENSADESIKITVRFLSNEIRADGLEVIIHKKICIENKCSIKTISDETNSEIKLAILKKATLFEKGIIKKKVRERRKALGGKETGSETSSGSEN